MANRKKRPSYGTAKQKDVEALMGALLTQVRAEMADAINLALKRHDAWFHSEQEIALGISEPIIAAEFTTDLALPDSRLVGLNGEPL